MTRTPTGRKLSVSLDCESSLLLQAVEQDYPGTSQAIQSIIKEWAADRGITVEIKVTRKEM